MLYPKQYNQVCEFNRVTLGKKPTTGIQPLDGSRLTDRVKFIQEELDELLEAPDAYEQVDALIDAIYFAMGGLYDIGVTLDDFENAFDAVHEANTKKVLGKKAGRDADIPDAAKPDDWVAPDLKEIIRG